MEHAEKDDGPAQNPKSEGRNPKKIRRRNPKSEPSKGAGLLSPELSQRWADKARPGNKGLFSGVDMHCDPVIKIQ